MWQKPNILENNFPFNKLVEFPANMRTQKYNMSNNKLFTQAKWFFIPPLHSAPQLGGSRRNIAIPFGGEKTRMVWLLDGEKALSICITVYTQYRRVMDRQTDGQTSCHGIVDAVHNASRGNN